MTVVRGIDNLDVKVYLTSVFQNPLLQTNIVPGGRHDYVSVEVGFVAVGGGGVVVVGVVGGRVAVCCGK